MIHTDTIAAIATAMGNSGIGIVRISGQEAVAVADRIFKEKGKQETLEGSPSHTIHYGYIYDGDQVVDEVLVMLMRGPRSFTAEDTVEIDCHGGMLVTRRILETVLKAGARLAEPGEFTKRAFLNGRIDLSQAEAVIDVINAKNEYALKSSVGQLRGSVSKKIRELREKILYEIAFIESALDDPEHISLDGYGERLLIGVQKMEQELSRLIRSSANGRVVSEGIRTVILGKPNAGKSSLMNVLVGEDRAIVTDIAGTTRDILEEHIYLQGISLNVVDTAGIRSTSDVVEKIGVERAMEAARDADLIIYVVDGSRELDENDLQIMELIRERKAVVLLNKSDLEPVVSLEEIAEKSGHRVISISAKEETGIDQLEEEIKSLFYEGEIDFNDQILITNVRHAEALREAYDSIRMVENSIESGMPEDFFSIDLMNAYEKLGLIVGEAAELTRNILIDWVPVFEDKEIGYDIDIPERPVRVRLDADGYMRIINNLIQNAVAHSGGDEIKIALSEQGAAMKLLVADNGVGIGKEDLKHIFERLYKCDKGRSQKGSGLGLSIVHQLVEKMGGSITVESTPGKGTEFTLVFPLDE